MNKQIPSKNYIILAVIVVITILVVFYARNWYITTREYNEDNSPMLKVVSEINLDEINNYAAENPKFILYTSSGLNTDIKRFESKFKNYTVDKGLSQNILYVNTADTDLEYLNNQLKKYATANTKNKISTSENVNMYIFENKQITHVIVNANNLTNEQIDSLLNDYGILEND